MGKKVIYAPSGAAREYGDLAINPYRGCKARCFYCFAPAVLHKVREEFHGDESPRDGIVEATRKQLERERISDKLIHIGFVCDAYPKTDSTVTREIITLLKQHGNHVQILTKNGADAMRDFDLLDENDWFGVTYAGYATNPILPPSTEPGAGAPFDRLKALVLAKSQGIKTWVSCEPVLNAASVFRLIETGDYIDKFKIGKLNYHPSGIDWKAFGEQAEALCKTLGRNYYIKDSLRKEMNKGD